MPQNNPLQVFEGGWKELENGIFTDNQTSLALADTLTSFFIRPDGRELYVLETNVSLDDIIHTYPLAIPWDPNSRGDEIRSFVFSDDLIGVGLNFQDDGSKMFVGGAGSKVMFAFTLPVPYDTDSIIASPVSLSLSAVSGVLSGSAFSRDGDFLFVNELTGGFTYSFPLPTPWDITSNVSNTSFDTSLITLSGITVKPEGDKMYLIDNSVNDTIHEFDMSTPNDISTLVANGNILDVNSVEILDLKFRTNGTQIFTIDDDDLFTRRHSDDQWDISTASLFTNILSGVVDYQAISWKSDGTIFFALNSGGGDRIDNYVVPDRWNQANAISDGNFSLAGIATTPRGMWVSPDGLTCMVVDTNNDMLVQLDMSTSWDITTMTNPGISFDLGAAGLVNPTGIAFSKDLLTFYITDSDDDEIHQFTMSGPLDIASAVDTGNAFSLPDDAVDVVLRPDDSLIYVAVRFTDRIIMYSLPADGNISNIVFLQELLVDFLEDNLQGFFIRENDGEKIWISCNQSGSIQCLDMSQELNNALITDFGEEITTDIGETLVYT